MSNTSLPHKASIIIPCLNEEESLGFCLEEINQTAEAYNLPLEVIVADNGSSDHSIEIAKQYGAKVIQVPEKGYGAALDAGIRSAANELIIMGDADGSYDFKAIPTIIDKLTDGNDLVMGCRFPYGGGNIQPGAMPFLHKYLGNPFFSLFVRTAFQIPIKDAYCGLRGFTKTFYHQIRPESKGMVFAIEMLLRAGLYKFKVAEFSTELRRDQRRTATPHLKTFRDGWKTLKLLLTYSPEGLYIIPASLLIILGIIGITSGLLQFQIFGVTLSLHSATLSTLFLISGIQYFILGGFIIGFSHYRGMRPMPVWFHRFSCIFSTEKGVIAAFILIILSFLCFLKVFYPWALGGFGGLDYEQNMPFIISAVVSALIGLQIFFASFMFELLLHRNS